MDDLFRLNGFYGGMMGCSLRFGEAPGWRQKKPGGAMALPAFYLFNNYSGNVPLSHKEAAGVAEARVWTTPAERITWNATGSPGFSVA